MIRSPIALMAVLLLAPLFVALAIGFALGLAVPLLIGPVRRRVVAHVEAIHAAVKTEERAQAVEHALRPRGFSGIVRGPARFVVGDGGSQERVEITPDLAQAALRDAKRRYGFSPDAGGES